MTCALIVKLTLVLAEPLPASVAATMNVTVPDVAGVPVMVTVPLLLLVAVRPAGKPVTTKLRPLTPLSSANNTGVVTE